MRRRNCCWYYLCSCFNYDDSRQVHKEIKKKMKEFIEENASRKSKNCKHKKQLNQSMKQMAPNKFYEEVDFQNRDLSCKNLFRFFNFLLEGVDPNENKVA